MPTRRRRQSNVGSGNGARRRHEPTCTCTGCRTNRYMDAWDAGNHVTITLQCPEDQRHLLGAVRVEAWSYELRLSPHRATQVVGTGEDYGHDPCGREGALLTASPQRASVTVVGDQAVELPRRVEWVCLACVRAGRIDARQPKALRTERLVRLARAMLNKASQVTVPATPQALQEQVDRLEQMPRPRDPR